MNHSVEFSVHKADRLIPILTIARSDRRGDNVIRIIKDPLSKHQPQPMLDRKSVV